MNPIIAAYYYPGWHSCPVRDASFPRGWSEWDLVYQARPAFDGHELPCLPLWGREDESDPEVFARKIAAANEYGIDAFVFAFYWSRGKRLLEGALKKGLLQAKNRQRVKFALMWANRMPRKVMPVKDAAARIIDPSRLVYTDPKDFVDFIETVAGEYFIQPEYLEINGAKYLSIFDSAFFIKQLGYEEVRKAIDLARKKLADRGMKMHLAAIDPISDHQPHLVEMGFDSVTHYVFLPDWKGEHLQDFRKMAQMRQQLWPAYPQKTGLPYFPAVTPGWDANPRGVDYGKERPGKYPWSPIITGRSPEAFSEFVSEALAFLGKQNCSGDNLCMISSWNEWSEGHYLEPDEKYAYAWLEAVKNAKNK